MEPVSLSMYSPGVGPVRYAVDKCLSGHTVGQPLCSKQPIPRGVLEIGLVCGRADFPGLLQQLRFRMGSVPLRPGRLYGGNRGKRKPLNFPIIPSPVMWLQ